MPLLKSEVLLCTGSDERFPPTNITDGSPGTFFLTTGGYPHEVIVGFKGGVAANITKISLVSSGIKHLIIHRCVEPKALQYEQVLDLQLNNREANRQVEQFQVNAATIGSRVRFLKFTMQSGYEPFSAIFDISVEGDEIAGSEA